jgi:hypothetical protein
LPSREIIALAREDHDPGGFVVAQIGEKIKHLAMELRAHGIPLLGPVKSDRRDAVRVAHEQRLVSFSHRCSPFQLIAAATLQVSANVNP